MGNACCKNPDEAQEGKKKGKMNPSSMMRDEAKEV